MSNLKEEKKNIIIDLAAREFADKGFETANINKIATMSGIGKGSIYLYFKNKKHLYLATMEKVVEKINESSNGIEDMDIPLFEKIRKIVSLIFKLEQDSLPYLVLWSRYQLIHLLSKRWIPYK